jgi:hypothetical protein
MDADLALTLQDLINNPEVGFIANSPLFSEIIKKNKLQPMQGNLVEFDVTYRGPSDPVALNSGFEPYDYRSNAVLTLGNARSGRHIYPWGVSNADFDLAGSPGDKLDIMKKKATAAMADMEDQLAFAVASGGDSSGVTLMTGAPTLNGDATYTARSTTYNGLLYAGAKASQTNTRLGISSATYNDVWYNQYATTSAFATDGVKNLQKVVNACNNVGGASAGVVDLGFCDTVSFSNFLEEARGDHRIVLPGPNALKGGPGSIEDTREFVLFGKVKIFSDPHIVLSRFSTGSTGNGLFQLLTTKQLFLASPFKVNQLFTVKEKKDIPGQDVRGYEIISDFTMYTKMLPKHGILANTNA